MRRAFRDHSSARRRRSATDRGRSRATAQTRPSTSYTRRCRGTSARLTISDCRHRRGSASCCRNPTRASCRSRRGIRREDAIATVPWRRCRSTSRYRSAGRLKKRRPDDGARDSEELHPHPAPIAEIDDVGDRAHRAKAHAISDRAEDECERKSKAGDEGGEAGNVGHSQSMISRLSQMSIVPARQPDCATHAELRERPLLWFDGVEHETKNSVRQIEGPV